MRALVLISPFQAEVQEVADPLPSPGQVIVRVERAGVCGTDVELFTGEMAYLHDGNASYPLRPGHEWMGTVESVADDVDAVWIGARVTGEPELGCGRCDLCARGRQHVCDHRLEVGVRGGFPGALADKIAVPETSLHLLPESVDATAGALVEPGANAWRAVSQAGVTGGDRVLIMGPGAIGQLCAMFARSLGAEVHFLGRSGPSLTHVRAQGWDGVWTRPELPDLAWNVVIDASNSPELPALGLQLVEPGGRIVYIGLAGQPSQIDTRQLVLKDVKAVGVMGGSPGFAATIDAFALGAVDPRPLVSAVVGLEQVPSILAGARPAGAGPGPKTLVDLLL